MKRIGEADQKSRDRASKESATAPWGNKPFLRIIAVSLIAGSLTFAWRQQPAPTITIAQITGRAPGDVAICDNLNIPKDDRPLLNSRLRLCYTRLGYDFWQRHLWRMGK
jgi:hypothetical protein